jgi:DNA-binding response OmpR family regulator
MTAQDDSKQQGIPKAEQPDVPLILIVDDEPLALDIAETTLQRQGFRTLTARGGQAGLDQVYSHHPDMVLLDITMPDIDGFSVFQTLRENPEYVNLPVIFVTARDDMGDKVRGLELGAVDYITKPYNPSELVARVRSTLRMQRLEREAADREREAARRKIVETLLVTLAHYINNALAAIDGRVAVTDPDTPDSVAKLLEVVRRRTRVIAATLQCIEEIQEDIETHTTQYASSDVEILNLEERIQQRVKLLEERDQEQGPLPE